MDDEKTAPGQATEGGSQQYYDDSNNTPAGTATQPDSPWRTAPIDAYIRHGWSLVPIPSATKGPITNGWNLKENALKSHADLPSGWGIGLAHAYSGTMALDIDDWVLATAALKEVGIDLDELYRSPEAVQIFSGRFGHGKLLFKMPAGLVLPSKKINRFDFASGKSKVALELRCATITGTTVQDVLPPSIHPDTNQSYAWGGAPWQQMAVIPQALLDWWRGLIEADNKREIKTNTPIDASWTEIQSAVEACDPDCSRDEWRNIGMALQYAGDETNNTERAFQMWNEWSARSWKYPGERDMIVQWRSFKSDKPNAVKLGTLFKYAQKCGWARPMPDVTPLFGPTEVLADADWPEAESLSPELPSGEYPVVALPEIVRAAVSEYLEYGQQPPSLVASSALGAVALSVQGLADVARDEKLVGPLSLNLLVVAQSGERKSAADAAFTQALAQWEREQRDRLVLPAKQNKAHRDAWRAERDGYEAAIRQAIKSCKDTNPLRQRLVEHAAKEPPELVLPRLRYEDCNPESLAHLLTNGHPSAALWSDEGGLVVGAHGMGRDSVLRFLALLNRLWDGRDFHQDRKTVESTAVQGRRFSACLMMQAVVFRGLLDGSQGLSRGSGFLARQLITQPTSTIGQRPYREPGPTPYLDAFNDRVRTMLDRPLQRDERGRLTPPVLSMSAAAKVIWTDYFNRVESRLGPFGDLDTVRDFASKSAENAVRLAGCFHLFEGHPGHLIRPETMQSAVRLAEWYLTETMRLLRVNDRTVVETDAALLDEWLRDRGGRVRSNEVLQSGPSRLRDKNRRDAAIAALIRMGRVRETTDGKSKFLIRNPNIRNNV